VQQYLISMYQPDGDQMPPPEVLGPIMQKVGEIRSELQAAGAWVFAGGLHPVSTATVVKIKDGDVLMTDGPYAEGKEHIGGFTIIQVPDLDAALEWAGRYARATNLPIEVRPFR
jgi:hypothetical protein